MTLQTQFFPIYRILRKLFFGMIEEAEEFLNKKKTQTILEGKNNLSSDKVREILSERPRIEKIAIKDVKLRTFITEDSSRDDLVAHVYDVTYGVIKSSDNLVIIDDSIVTRNNTEEKYYKNDGQIKPKTNYCSFLCTSN